MTACTILYASFYGSTKEYADELAKRLGTTAEPIPDADFNPEGPIVVLVPHPWPEQPRRQLYRQASHPTFRSPHRAPLATANEVHRARRVEDVEVGQGIDVHVLDVVGEHGAHHLV